MTYNFRDHKSGTTFSGVAFQLVVNNTPKSLVGTTISMIVGDVIIKGSTYAGKTFSTTTGELVITDAINGKFQFKKQVVNLSVCKHPYYIEFWDDDVKVYLEGVWKII
jgi:hypothetical protein